jgi:hypothetical protein
VCVLSYRTSGDLPGIALGSVSNGSPGTADSAVIIGDEPEGCDGCDSSVV